MARVTFEISEEGEVTTGHKSMQEAMIDSHIKFCKHTNLSATPRILQMAGSCETLEETVMLLDDDREKLCMASSVPYTRVSTSAMLGRMSMMMMKMMMTNF